MRVLVVSTEGAGHFTPLVPVIDAFRSRGDDVLVTSGPNAQTMVERTGAAFAPAGRTQGEMLARLAARGRGIPGDGLPPERILHYFLPRAFGEIGVDEMIDDVIAHGRRFAPDVVLFEACALAAPLAADILGVPAVAHMFGPLPPLDTVELANDAVSPIWRSFGLDAPGWAGMYRDLTVQICPPSLEQRTVPTGDTLQLRPAPLPTSPRVTTARPLVYVTFGTLFNADLSLFRLALDALAGEHVDVVMTVGRDQDPAALAPIPVNARVERFIPQAELLPSCAAIVHHGGAGTTFGALAHGVPQVILPQGADNYELAAMCEAPGAAAVLRPHEVSATALAAAVRDVLAHERYAAAGRACAAAIASMPDAVDTVAAIHAWLAARR